MKKKKTEAINKLCEKCTKSCKQSADVILLGCPNYEFKPRQLEIKFSYPRKKKKQ